MKFSTIFAAQILLTASYAQVSDPYFHVVYETVTVYGDDCKAIGSKIPSSVASTQRHSESKSPKHTGISSQSLTPSIVSIVSVSSKPATVKLSTDTKFTSAVASVSSSSKALGMHASAKPVTSTKKSEISVNALPKSAKVTTAVPASSSLEESTTSSLNTTHRPPPILTPENYVASVTASSSASTPETTSGNTVAAVDLTNAVPTVTVSSSPLETQALSQQFSEELTTTVTVTDTTTITITRSRTYTSTTSRPNVVTTGSVVASGAASPLAFTSSSAAPAIAPSPSLQNSGSSTSRPVSDSTFGAVSASLPTFASSLSPSTSAVRPSSSLPSSISSVLSSSPHGDISAESEVSSDSGVSTSPATSSTGSTSITSSSSSSTSASTTSSASSSSSTSSSASSASSPSPTLTSFQEEILSYHNQVRSQHSAPAMVWNETIAEFAQNYLNSVATPDTCTFQHSGGPYGENIALGFDTPTAAMTAWYDEYQYYNYTAAQFSEQTGHFTQMVWVGSTSVGCALQNCSSSNSEYLVCEYWPRGNIIGWFKDNVFPN